MRTLMLLLAFCGVSAGQAIQASGGDSTMVDGAGGGALFRFEHFTSQFGIGTIGGHVYFGFGEKLQVGKCTWFAGDSGIPFGFETDFQPAGLGLTTRGLSLTRHTDKSDLFAFAGASANGYGTSFFGGATAESPTTAMLYHRSITKHLTLASYNAMQHKGTSVQLLQYSHERYKVAVSGGIGSNAPFASSLLTLNLNLLDLKAGYTVNSRNFQRILTPQNYIMPEYTKGNVLAVFHPMRGIRVSGSHEDTFIPHTTREATVNAVSASAGTQRFSVSASDFQSWSGVRASGQIYGATFAPNRTASFGYQYFISGTATHMHHIGIGVFSQKLNRRFTATEYLSINEGGNKSIGFGGQYQSNRFDAGISYNESYNPYFIPGTSPFQRYVSAQIKIQLPHAVTLHGESNMAPNGKVVWTGWANEYAQGPIGSGAREEANKSSRQFSVGKDGYQGTATDESGNAISGLALRIDDQLVLTDMHGNFSVRFKKGGERKLTVSLKDSLLSGDWEIVSAPVTISPDQSAKVIVRYKPLEAQ